MERVLEPELMEDPEQARAYARADLSDADALFIAQLRRLVDASGPLVAADLGCGPGGLSIKVARAFPGWRLDLLDGSAAMLDLARQAILEAGLQERLRVVQGLLPAAIGSAGGLEDGGYDLVLSNSLLHHLPEPRVLWQGCKALLRPGGTFVVMDLFRPDSETTARRIVEENAADEHPVLKEDFYNSLLAAFEPEEVRLQLEQAGLKARVEVVSARHIVVAGRYEA